MLPPSSEDICRRLEVFASRTHEVESQEDRATMEHAVLEFRLSVVALVRGVTVRSLSRTPTETLTDNINTSIAALKQHGPVWSLRELEALKQVSVALDELFEGLDICRDTARDEIPLSSTRRTPRQD